MRPNPFVPAGALQRVGFIPGFPGAHTQAETLEELHKKLQEVVAMLLEDGEPMLESEFVGKQNVVVACNRWEIFLFSSLANSSHCLQHWVFPKFGNAVRTKSFDPLMECVPRCHVIQGMKYRKYYYGKLQNI
nr:type II toxin-antitoxin system HicB family antitoxin [Candidatus Symbiobacter mobilis]